VDDKNLHDALRVIDVFASVGADRTHIDIDGKKRGFRMLEAIPG
jgi:hypothetical protein